MASSLPAPVLAAWTGDAALSADKINYLYWKFTQCQSCPSDVFVTLLSEIQKMYRECYVPRSTCDQRKDEIIALQQQSATYLAQIAQFKEDRASLTERHLAEMAQLKEERASLTERHRAEMAQLKEDRASLTERHLAEMAQLKEDRASLREKHLAQIAGLRKQCAVLKATAEAAEKFHASETAALRKAATSNEETLDMYKREVHSLRLMCASKWGADTRAEFFFKKVIETDPARIDQPLPISPVTGSTPEMRPILENPRITENQMYSPVTAFLSGLLPDHTVSDTHLNAYLSDRAPDITISLKGINQIHKQYVITFVEIKRPTAALDRSAKGQALDQAYKLAECQPWRRTITMLVSNIKSNVFITLERNEKKLELKTYSSVNFETAMQYLKRVVNDPESQPQFPPFSTQLGAVDKILGNTKLSAVAQFTVKGVPAGTSPVAEAASTLKNPTAIAVKHCTADLAVNMIKNEIRTLRLLQTMGGHDRLPKILFHTPDELGYAMLPVAQPVDTVLLNNNGFMARTVTSDVLSAMTWLHERGIVHRDIRWDNIMMHSEHGLLVDFGAAVFLPTPPVSYQGGFACCPPRVLPVIDRPYTPSRADDYHAYVLLFNAVLHPRSMKSFLSRMVDSPHSNESKCLQHLWAQLTKSDTWGRYVAAAAREDLDVLRKLPEALVVLDKRPDAAWRRGEQPDLDLDEAFGALELEPGAEEDADGEPQ
ncbi:hypothetical protein FN846DRAFT_891524 [Sphaerosporella brunnea]|uniref:EKC/KEOPS complex subunit BUD32 n=1 Tax=Sphaerosporella brunnea TaxID=1250544 RepID=A0A5J5ESL6_9PEZI|nr:hypothetical protein FN846DRAFT_891524 [Sphaerosporella brunnea]